MKSYATSLVRQHDKDGDMILKGDERSGLRNKAATSDLNHDGSITVDELVMGLSGTQPAAPGVATPARESAASGERSTGSERARRRGAGREGAADQRRTAPGGKPRVYTALAASTESDDGAKTPRTYRFTPGRERLPSSGLPSWFKSRDKNGDGQVAMSEYSRTWSVRTVNEFRRYDRDGDGMVTAGEASEN
jgi:Ca2+-binding EF-hand superfamily protein